MFSDGCARSSISLEPLISRARVKVEISTCFQMLLKCYKGFFKSFFLSLFSRFWFCYLWEWRCGWESVWDPLPWDQQQNGTDVSCKKYLERGLLGGVGICSQCPNCQTESCGVTVECLYFSSFFLLTPCFLCFRWSARKPSPRRWWRRQAQPEAVPGWCPTGWTLLCWALAC